MENLPHNRISTLTAKLDELTSFLTEWSFLTECHLVDFITHDLFASLLPSSITSILLTLSDVELALLPSCQLIDVLASTGRSESHAELIKFLQSCQRFSVEHFFRDSSVSDYLASVDDICRTHKLKLKYCTREKKSHEIEEMASAVATTAADLGIDLVIDIGSGRGYLGSLLHMYYGLRVLGFDASDCNTHSASQRLDKVQKDWKTALRRACAGDTSSNCNRIPVDKGFYRPITCSVNASTSLNGVVDNFDMVDNADGLILCGLHTCGDLASNALRMYVECERAKGILLVGCCYHLIEEQFSKNPFRKESDPPPDFHGFPLSRYLKEIKFGIGRNTRILSSQPVCKMAKEISLPNRALFWRAVLQQFVSDKLGCNIDIFEKRVGRVAKRCQDFSEYVPKALKNLGLDLSVALDEIKHYEMAFMEYERKMKAFFQLRCALARPVETAVLIDRMLYLLEQETVAETKVVPLFDPAISPRCYSIWSRKKY